MINETKKAISRDCKSPLKIGFKEYKNCNYLVSNGVSNGKIYDGMKCAILESETYSPNKNNYSPEVPSSTNCRSFGPSVAIFLGNLPFVFGHSFTDGLKSIWFYFTDECKKLLDNGARIVFAVPSESVDFPSFYRIIFKALGIEISDAIFIRENTHFENIIVPDLCWGYIHGNLTYSNEYVFLINRIKDNILNETIPSECFYEKVYLTRTKFSDWQREVGEKHIEQLFATKGYSIISPELLSFDRQIQLMHHCRYLATTEGSISHLAVFCRPETKVVILRKTNWVNPYQIAINQIASIDVTIVDVHKTKVCKEEWKRMSGPFYLCITNELRRFLGVSRSICPVFFYPSYWWYRIRLNPWVMSNIMNRRIVHKLLNV